MLNFFLLQLKIVTQSSIDLMQCGIQHSPDILLPYLPTILHFLLMTYAKDVMFLDEFVCLSVFMITQNQ